MASPTPISARIKILAIRAVRMIRKNGLGISLPYIRWDITANWVLVTLFVWCHPRNVSRSYRTVTPTARPVLDLMRIHIFVPTLADRCVFLDFHCGKTRRNFRSGVIRSPEYRTTIVLHFMALL